MTRILVVHARGGVGDVVLSTPVLEAAWRGLPSPEITMLVRSGAAGVVEHNPYLADCIVVPDAEWDHGQPYRKLLSDIRRRAFDIGMVLWSKAPEAWLLRLAGIPVRVGQAGRVLYSVLYTHQVPVRSERGDTTSHWMDLQLDYARALGLPTEGLLPHLAVADADIAWARDRLPGTRPLVGFSVGKGLALTPGRWPVDAFAAMADAVSTALGATVILTGGGEERAVVEAVAERMRQPRVCLAGDTSLLQLAAVIGQCQAFICPDSGPMHMAAAMGVPTVGIFAMRCEFPERWRPYGPRTTVVRPVPVTCALGCRKETCVDFHCYRAVSPAEVVAAVRQVIEERVRS